MDLNKVLEKELDAWLVPGKWYCIPGDGNRKFIRKESIVKFSYPATYETAYHFSDGDRDIGNYCATYLAWKGIKEVVEDPDHFSGLTRPFVYKSEKVVKEELKQKVLAEVDNLILGEEEYINFYSSTSETIRNVDGNSAHFAAGKVVSAKASLRNLKELKEKINGL